MCLIFVPFAVVRTWAAPSICWGPTGGLCLMSMHAGMHWNPTAKTRRGKLLLRAGAALVCLYGGIAFVRRDIGTYLLLKSHFVFFNYEEPLALFLFDYLSVIALFAILGCHLSKILKRPQKYMIRCQAWIAALIAIVVVVNIIRTGPMFTLLPLAPRSSRWSGAPVPATTALTPWAASSTVR